MWRKIKPIAKSRNLNCLPSYFKVKASRLKTEKNTLENCAWYKEGLRDCDPGWICLGNKQHDIYGCLNCNRKVTETTDIPSDKQCVKPQVRCELFDKILKQISSQRKYIVTDEATNWYKAGQAVCTPKLKSPQPVIVERKSPILCASQYKRISSEFLRLLQSDSDKSFQQAENIIGKAELKLGDKKIMPCVELPKQCVTKRKTSKSASSKLKTTEASHRSLKNPKSKEVWKANSKEIVPFESHLVNLVQPKQKATVKFIDQQDISVQTENNHFTLKVPIKNSTKLKAADKYLVEVVLNRQITGDKSKTKNSKSTKLIKPIKSILKQRDSSDIKTIRSKEKSTQTESLKHQSRSFVRNLRSKRKLTPHSSRNLSYHSSHTSSDTKKEERVSRKVEPKDKIVADTKKEPKMKGNRLKGGCDRYSDSSVGSFFAQKPILSVHEIHKPLSYERSMSDYFDRDRHRHDTQKVRKIREEYRKDKKPQSSKPYRNIYKVHKVKSSNVFLKSPEHTSKTWKIETKRNTERNEQESRNHNKYNNKLKASTMFGASHSVHTTHKDVDYNVYTRNKRKSKREPIERPADSAGKDLSSSCVESSASAVSKPGFKRNEFKNRPNSGILQYRHRSRQYKFPHRKEEPHPRVLSGGERSISNTSFGSNNKSEVTDFLQNVSNDIIVEASRSEVSENDGSSAKSLSSDPLPHIDSKDIYVAVPKCKVKNLNRASRYLRSKKPLVLKKKELKKRNRYLKDHSTRLQSGSDQENFAHNKAKRFFWQRRDKNMPNKGIDDDEKQSKYYIHERKKRQQSPNESENDSNRYEEVTQRAHSYNAKSDPKRKVYELWKSSFRQPTTTDSNIYEKSSESVEENYEKPSKSTKNFHGKLKESEPLENFGHQDSFIKYSREYISTARPSRYDVPSSSNRKSTDDRVYERDLNAKPLNFKHNAQKMEYLHEQRHYNESDSDSEEIDDRYYKSGRLDGPSSMTQISNTHLKTDNPHAPIYSSKKPKKDKYRSDNYTSYKFRKDGGQYQGSNFNLQSEEFLSKEQSRSTSEEYIQKEILYSTQSAVTSESAQSNNSQFSTPYYAENTAESVQNMHNVPRKSSLKPIKGKKPNVFKKRPIHRYPSPSFHKNGIPGQVVIKKIMREDLLDANSRIKRKDLRRLKQNHYENQPQSYRVLHTTSPRKHKYSDVNSVEPEYTLGFNESSRNKVKRYKN